MHQWIYRRRLLQPADQADRLLAIFTADLGIGAERRADQGAFRLTKQRALVFGRQVRAPPARGLARGHARQGGTDGGGDAAGATPWTAFHDSGVLGTRQERNLTPTGRELAVTRRLTDLSPPGTAVRLRALSLRSIPMPVWLQTAALLSLSNLFMTFAWYGHLKTMNSKPWVIAALVSWGIALCEYLIMVPANRIGYTE